MITANIIIPPRANFSCHHTLNQPIIHSLSKRTLFVCKTHLFFFFLGNENKKTTALTPRNRPTSLLPHTLRIRALLWTRYNDTTHDVIRIPRTGIVSGPAGERCAAVFVQAGVGVQADAFGVVTGGAASANGGENGGGEEEEKSEGCGGELHCFLWCL